MQSAFEGSLEVKLPTIWADEKCRDGQRQREEESGRKKIRKEKESGERSRKKLEMREMVRKSRNPVFF
jgi:hypothetical protein